MSEEDKNINPPKKVFRRSIFHKVVNAFILLVIIVIALLFLSIGFAQTSWFRDIARNKIVKVVNENINGEFFLKSVNGTFINSLKLNDFGVVVEGDTLFHSDEANVKISLSALITKKLFISNFRIKNPDFRIFEDSLGRWNLSKVLKQDSVKTENLNKKDEFEKSSGEFPFVLELGNFQIDNGNIILQSYNHLGDDSVYQYVNYDDFRLTNFNIKLNAVGDINKNEFAIYLKKLNFKDNLKTFNLDYLSGSFIFTPKYVEVKKLHLKTDSSDVRINSKFVGLNLFDKINYSGFKNYPLSLSLNCKPFHFSDLSTFLPSVDFLRGPVDIDLLATGKYGNIDIKQLALALGYTKLHLEGSLKNLENPKNLFIDANINNSRVDYDEVIELLAGLNLPEYNNLKLDSLNIHYKGEPIKFNADVIAKINDGKINANTFFDFTGDEMVYDIDLKSDKLDLSPVIKEKSYLNLTAKLKGRGTNPKTMENEILLNAENSSLNGYRISSFNFQSTSNNGNSDISVDANINQAKVNLNSQLNLTDSKNDFVLSSKVANLDLSALAFDSSLSSNLNFNFNVSGTEVDSGAVEGELQLNFDSSMFRGSNALSNTHWQMNVWGDSTYRNFDLSSDVLDAYIEGNFSYQELPILIARQGTRIVKLVKDEIAKEFTTKSLIDSSEIVNVDNENLPELKIKYNILLKKSEIIAKILQLNKFEVNGYFKGSIINNQKEFVFSNNTFFRRFVLLDSSQFYFANNFQFDANIENKNTEDDLQNLFVKTKMNADNLYFGKQLGDVKLNFDMSGKRLQFDVAATIDTNLTIASNGDLQITSNGDSFTFEKFKVNSHSVEWKNVNPFSIIADNGTVTINGMNFISDSAAVSLSGKYNEQGKNDIKLFIRNLELSRVFQMASGNKSSEFDGVINLEGKITGTVAFPEINSNMECSNFSYKNQNFGNIELTENYLRGISNIFIKVVNGSVKDNDSLKFALAGVIPYNLFGESSNLNREINLHLKANDFNLAALSTIIPSVSNQHGTLNSQIDISGDIENPMLNGFVEINNGGFKVESTGMDYLLGSRIEINDNLFSIQKMFLKNGVGSNLSGQMNFAGKFLLDHYRFKEFSVNVQGNLPLLDKRSRYVSPDVYGDLIVGTNGKLNLIYKGDRALLTGNLVVKQGNITFTNESSAKVVDISDINYEYVVDSTKLNRTELFLKNYLTEQLNSENVQNLSSGGFLDYEMNFAIENRASLTFIFSKVVNQKLYVQTNGSLSISNIEGNQSAQGTFNLLPGSRLEFIKTFDATGFVRFEGDLTNPYFNIEAVYENSYVSNQGTPNETEKLVAVKIKLDGSLKDLAKRLATEKSNITVYVGKKNIDNNVADPQLSASDAFSFILLGKFSRDLTSNEKYQLSSELTNTATSMLGTVMAGFLNSQVGDLINDIQVRQSSYETKVTLKGRVGKFYYSLGGSQQVFQDLSKASWKFEYFFNRNLSFRLERREPLTGYFSNTQMTDEIAIKYKVTF